MRKKIVAGNWKMNNDIAQSIDLATEIVQQLNSFQAKADVILLPNFVSLNSVNDIIKQHGNIKLGAQNAYPKPSGAYTGEVSLAMLKSANVKYILVGHSERREYFKESHEFLKQKIDAILSENLIPIFCCGEPLTIRQEQTHQQFVKKQMQESLLHLSAEQICNCVIAYEPVWAIGTGLNATAEQAQEMHQFIRNTIAENYDSNTAQSVSILYGGSCNATNAKSIFGQQDVDGGLIGGASLKANDFIQIIKSI